MNKVMIQLDINEPVVVDFESKEGCVEVGNYMNCIVPFYDGKGFVDIETEEAKELRLPLSTLKSQKLSQLESSAVNALKSFTYDSLTFENSGESKSNLIYAQSAIQADQTQQIKWRALNGTYELSDRNSIMITTSNISQFASAMLSHNNNVFTWQDQVEALLINASTREEVEAISTEYQQ